MPPNFVRIRYPQVLTAPTPGPVTPRSLRPLLVGQPPDERLAADPYSQGSVQLLGGRPSRAVTPPTLRPVLRETTLPDDASYQRPAEGNQLGTRPNGPVTPPTLRSLLACWQPDLTPDRLLDPCQQGGATLQGGRPRGAVTPPTLRLVTVVLGDDRPAAEPPPAPALARGWKPTTAATSPPVVIAVVIGDELPPLLTAPAAGTVHGGRPSRAVTPPSLRALVAAPALPPPEALTDPSLQGTYDCYGGLASRAVTPPSPRPVLALPAANDAPGADPAPYLAAIRAGVATVATPPPPWVYAVPAPDDYQLAAVAPAPALAQFSPTEPALTVLYLTSTADGLLATANQLTAARPSPDTSFGTVVGNLTGWFELYSQGNPAANPGGITEPAQSGNGFIWDVTSLEGRKILAGDYSAAMKLSTSTGSLTADVHVRFSRRSAAGVYTTIVDLSLAGQVITTVTASHVLAGSTGAATTFAAGDKLYVDVLLKVTAAAALPTTQALLFENGDGGTEWVGIPVSVPLTAPVTATIYSAAEPVGGPDYPATLILAGRPLPPRVPRWVAAVFGHDDGLSPARPAEGVVLGGRPSRPATPPSLRPLVREQGPEDALTPPRPPEGLVLGAPPLLRPGQQVLPAPRVVPAEDVLSRERHPYAVVLTTSIRGSPPPPTRPFTAGAEDQASPVLPPTVLLWTPYTTVVNQFPAPQPRITAPEDALTPQPAPAALVLWARPAAPRVAYSRPLPLFVPAEDVLTPQVVAPTLYRTVARPGTPPSLRPLTTTLEPDAGVALYGRGAEAWILVTQQPARTPPTLRPPLVVLAEDTVSPALPATTAVLRGPGFQLTLRPVLQPLTTEDRYTPEPPPTGLVYGGRPARATTPPLHRPPLYVPAEDALTPPRHPEALLYGGRPSAASTPPARPFVVVVTAEDALSLLRNPEAWLLAGPRLPPATGPRPATVITADDVLSTQRLPDTLVLGGRPSRPVTPRSLRSAIVVPAEDLLSRLPPPTVLYGGLPSAAVTPRSLRGLTVGATPDVYSPENVPPPVLLRGMPHTQVSPVPVTPLADVWRPTTSVTGKVGGTTDG